MDQLGPTQVIAYARRLGLESPLPPYLAVALGAAEATLIEMTSAYSVYPNQGVRMRPVLGAQGQRPRRQRARGEPAGAEGRDSRRHRVRDDQPPARRRPARHGGEGGRRSTGRSAARPAPPTTTPTPGSSASIPTSRIGVWVGFDQKRTMGPGGTGVGCGAADLDRHHEGVDRRPQGRAAVRGARQHRLRGGRPGLRQRPSPKTPPARSPSRSSPAPSRAPASDNKKRPATAW